MERANCDNCDFYISKEFIEPCIVCENNICIVLNCEDTCNYCDKYTCNDDNCIKYCYCCNNYKACMNCVNRGYGASKDDVCRSCFVGDWMCYECYNTLYECNCSDSDLDPDNYVYNPPHNNDYDTMET
jgi:hypothetical protein